VQPQGCFEDRSDAQREVLGATLASLEYLPDILQDVRDTLLLLDLIEGFRVVTAESVACQHPCEVRWDHFEHFVAAVLEPNTKRGQSVQHAACNVERNQATSISRGLAAATFLFWASWKQ
jgi:hypothetical protein